MKFRCDTCKVMKDVGDVVRTKPFTAERRVKCHDCYDAEDKAEEAKKKSYAFQWLLDLLRTKH